MKHVTHLEIESIHKGGLGILHASIPEVPLDDSLDPWMTERHAQEVLVSVRSLLDVLVVVVEFRNPDGKSYGGQLIEMVLYA